jgi:hypothetical protein
MRISRMAIGAVLFAALQARAQSADTASRVAAARGSPPPATGTLTFGSIDTGTVGEKCWGTCTLAKHRADLSEWENAPEQRAVMLLEAHRARQSKAFPDTARLLQHASSSPVPVPLVTAVTDTSPAARAKAERYWIEEWRRTQHAVVDSLHHIVLLKLTRLFDSAQSHSFSPDDYVRILNAVDGMNRVNQYMWATRTLDVERQADSAVRAIPASP